MRIAVVTLAVALILALVYPQRVIGLRSRLSGTTTVTPVDTTTPAASAAKAVGKKVESSHE